MFVAVCQKLHGFIAIKHATCIKINVDAAVESGESGVGLGAVARNEYGLVIAANSSYINAPIGVLSAEILAIKEGHSLACPSGCNFYIESNCANASQNKCSDTDVVISDVKLLVSTTGCKILKFIKREATFVAHVVAKHSLIRKECARWNEDVSQFIFCCYSKLVINL